MIFLWIVNRESSDSSSILCTFCVETHNGIPLYWTYMTDCDFFNEVGTSMWTQLKRNYGWTFMYVSDRKTKLVRNCYIKPTFGGNCKKYFQDNSMVGVTCFLYIDDVYEYIGHKQFLQQWTDYCNNSDYSDSDWSTGSMHNVLNIVVEILDNVYFEDVVNQFFKLFLIHKTLALNI